MKQKQSTWIPLVLCGAVLSLFSVKACSNPVSGFSVVSCGVFFANLLADLPALVISLCTIWYVYYTYLLLKTSSAALTGQFQPLARIDWFEETVKHDDCFERFDYLSRNDFVVLRRAKPPDLAGHFAALRVTNRRQVTIQTIEIDVRVQLLDVDSGTEDQPGHGVKTINLTFEKNGLQMLENEDIQITVQDLTLVPKGALVVATIERFAYSSGEPLLPGNQLFSGTKERTFEGRFPLPGGTQTRPVLDPEAGG